MSEIKVFSNSAIELPVADNAYPRIELITEILERDGRPNNIIKKINDNYDKMLAVNGPNPQSKNVLDEKQTREMRAINDDTKPYLKEYGIEVESLGGNTTNKNGTLKGALGDSIHCRQIGAVGDDSAGRFMREKMAAAGIEFVDMGITMPGSREAIALIPRGGNDRIASSFHFVYPKEFNFKNLLDETLKDNSSMIEATLIKYMSQRELVKFGHTLIENNSMIFNSPPTKHELYLNSGNNKIIYDKDASFDMGKMGSTGIASPSVNAFYRLGKMSHIVFMNEGEAIDLIKGPGVNGKVHNPDDPMLQEALIVIQSSLKKDTSKNADKKLRFVTMKQGAFVIHKDFTMFVKAQENVPVVNNLGAGDTFVGGVLEGYIKNGNAPLTVDNVARWALNGNNLAAGVLQITSAQLPHKDLKRILDDSYKMPLAGKVITKYPDFQSMVKVHSPRVNHYELF